MHADALAIYAVLTSNLPQKTKFALIGQLDEDRKASEEVLRSKIAALTDRAESREIYRQYVQELSPEQWMEHQLFGGSDPFEENYNQ